MTAKAAPNPSKSDLVALELNPAGGVDVLGEGNPPLLWSGVDRDFTKSEADALLALRNEHGTAIVRIVRRGAKK